MSNIERQAKLYNSIHINYAESYFDEFSNKYRRDFMYSKLLSLLVSHTSTSLTILDLGCASGDNYLFLDSFLCNYDKTLNYIGIDLSPSAIKLAQQRFPDQTFICGDINNISFNEHISSSSVDFILFIGVLHHLSGNIWQASGNILKQLCHSQSPCIYIVEPNYYYFLSRLRQIWYSFDPKIDESSEIIVQPETIIQCFADHGFKFSAITFQGFLAYFLIMQSFLLRVPRFCKPFLCKIFWFPEKIFNAMHLPDSLYPFISIAFLKRT